MLQLQFDFKLLVCLPLLAQALSSTAGDFFLSEFSTADVIFTPYIERMNASLYYYKGYVLRDPAQRPRISAWFDAMETRPTYLGTQSDFHTHVHDLPPQMGGCYESAAIAAQPECKERIDCGPWSAGATAPWPRCRRASPRLSAATSAPSSAGAAPCPPSRPP